MVDQLRSPTHGTASRGWREVHRFLSRPASETFFLAPEQTCKFARLAVTFGGHVSLSRMRKSSPAAP
jgi:hypothetical protein